MMRLTYYSSWQTQCGVAEYSNFLLNGLRDIQQTDVDIVVEPFFKGSLLDTRLYYRSLGRTMNSGDLAHIQHAHSFFGGRSPVRNSFRYFIQQVHIPIVLTAHDIFSDSIVSLPESENMILNGSNEKSLNSRISMNFHHWIRKVIWPHYENWYRTDLYQKVAAIIVHSDVHKRMLVNGGAPETKIYVVPHGIPTEAVVAKDKLIGKTKWGLDDKIVLTIFGFMVPRKGYELALETLKALNDQYILFIAGGTSKGKGSTYFTSLLEKIKIMGLEDRVVFSGFLPADSIPDAMAATDIVLAPFIESTGSGSLSFAIAYQKPIVASDIAINVEINSHSHCMSLFANQNSEKLQERILELANSSEIKSNLIKGCIEYSHKYSFHNVAKSIFDIYQNIQPVNLSR